MTDEDQRAFAVVTRVACGCSAIIALAGIGLIVLGVIGFIRWMG